MSLELEIAEIGALRSELNAVIDRMNVNENFSSGTISAIFAFILSTDTTVISFVLSLLSMVIVSVGFRRYWELTIHADKIDAYLVAIENKISSNGGWTVHYYKTIDGGSVGGYSWTRYVFWGALCAICLLGTFYVGYTIIYASINTTC